MYCSTCGAVIPANRRACETCGAARPRPALRDPAATAPGASAGVAPLQAALPTGSVLACPRCAYRGQGLPYFSRGSHVAGLVGATLFTVGFMGAGGAAYYLLRRDHRICPRCGKGWGRDGERAAPSSAPSTPEEREGVPPTWREGTKRGWAVLAFVFAFILAAAGIAEGELVPVLMSVAAAAGGFTLHRAAERDRESRRAALISSLQLPVLRLASQRRGVLTVTEVAAELGWPLRRAEKVLQSMDDGYRVSSEVTDEGLIVYEFFELRHSAERPPALGPDLPLA